MNFSLAQQDFDTWVNIIKQIGMVNGYKLKMIASIINKIKNKSIN